MLSFNSPQANQDRQKVDNIQRIQQYQLQQQQQQQQRQNIPFSNNAVPQQLFRAPNNQQRSIDQTTFDGNSGSFGGIRGQKLNPISDGINPNNPRISMNYNDFPPNPLQPYQSLKNPPKQLLSAAPIDVRQGVASSFQTESCPSHPKFDITNICVAKDCVEPLCPECVKIHTFVHNQNGTPTEIDTIFSQREQCLDYVRQLKQEFVKEQEILFGIGDINKGDDFFTQCLDSILRAKELLYQKIETFFSQFEIKLKQRVDEVKNSHPAIFDTIQGNILAMLRQVQDMENKLDSAQYVKYVIQILQDDFRIDMEKIQNDVDSGVAVYLEQLFSVKVNEDINNDLENLLNKYLGMQKIDTDQFKWRDQQNTNPNLGSLASDNQENINFNRPLNNAKQQGNKAISENLLQKKSIKQNQLNQLANSGAGSQQLPSSQNNLISNSKIVNSRVVDIQGGLGGDQSPFIGTERTDKGATAPITIYDYFTPECPMNILHFFQDNSKNFHLLDLTQLSSDPKSQEWQTVELNIPFKIPMFHRSISTPTGQIYLIGGVDVQHKNRTLGSTYFLEMTKNSLVLCSKLNVPRHSHSVLFAQDSIFVVGGINSQEEDICLQSCERFDIASNKWIEIASLPEGVCGATICNFDDKYIFRFGGKSNYGQYSQGIDRYNIQQDIWEQIAFSNIDSIPSFAGASQINEQEILILGGQVDEINQRQVLLATLNEEGISFSQAKSLPAAGTFWQNPIVGSRMVFALQNIKIDNSQSNYFGKKSVFVFNSTTWKELGRF